MTYNWALDFLQTHVRVYAVYLLQEYTVAYTSKRRNVASICIHVPTYILSKHDNCTDHGHPSQNGGKRGCSHGAGATAGTVEDSVG